MILQGTPPIYGKLFSEPPGVPEAEYPAFSSLPSDLFFHSLRESLGRREGRDGHRTVLAYHDPLGELGQ
ncbi:hypothetical protein, partial [Streptomyces sp. NPDC007904]|uniref:hypothetical protein n=1 Tax=Streptomyces sp. NPDC007904 TaxID=3364787 RepID=UPI0036EFF2B9